MPGTQLDGFESLESWYVLQDQGNLSPLKKDAYEGSQSAHVSSSQGDAYGAIFRAFSEPKDLRGKNVSIAVKVNKPQISKVYVDLLAPDRGNKVRMVRTLTGPVNRWLRLDMGVAQVDRNPNLSKVQEVRVICRHRGGKEAPVDFAVDDLRVAPRPKKGAVLLTFDDSHISHYEKAYKVMKEYGFPGVEGVIADSVYNSDRLDVGMMRRMSEDGWDMTSHPFVSGRQMQTYSRRKQQQMITDNKEFLVKKGFQSGARHFLTPQNMRGPNTQDLVEKHHETMFSFGGAPNGLPSTTTYNYGRFNPGDIDVVKQFVNYAARFKQLAVINHHIIGGDGMSESKFERELEYIDKANVEVVTASDLLERANGGN